MRAPIDCETHDVAVMEATRLAKRVAELEAENKTLVSAINELRHQMQTVADIGALFRRLPIADLAKANIERR